MAKHDDEEQKLLDSMQKVTVQPTPSVTASADPVNQPSHDLPASAPPVPADLDMDTSLDVPSSGTSLNVVESPVAIPEAANPDTKPAAPTAPALDLGMAEQVDDVATEEPNISQLETPTHTPATQEVQDHVPTSTEPERLQPTSSTPSVPPEKGNGTVGVIFEDPTPHRSVSMPTDAEPLPVLPDEPTPQSIIVSHHKPKAGGGKVFLVMLLIFVFALLIFNVLLDAGFITLDGVPHTDLF